MTEFGDPDHLNAEPQRRDPAVCIVSPKAYLAIDDGQGRTFGGAEMQLTLLARQLAKMGETVDLIVADYGQKRVLDEGGLRVIATLDMQRLHHPRGVMRLCAAIRSTQAKTVVKRTLSPLTFLVALTTRLSNKHFVYMVAHDCETDQTHPMFKTVAGRLMARTALGMAKLIIVQNELERAELARWLPGKKTAVLKKGVDAPEPLETEAPTYDAVWIGRCDDWKHPEAFIRLAQKLPRMRFAMACPPATGKPELHQRVCKAAAQANNLDLFRHLANSEVHRLLARAKVHVNTSSQEGDWPMSVLEAAANGVPTISLSIDYGGLTGDYGGAWGCQGDEEKMERALIRIATDENLREQMARGSRRYAKDHHNLSTQAAAFLSIVTAGKESPCRA